jgi:hypothetical protein
MPSGGDLIPSPFVLLLLSEDGEVDPIKCFGLLTGPLESTFIESNFSKIDGARGIKRASSKFNSLGLFNIPLGGIGVEMAGKDSLFFPVVSITAVLLMAVTLSSLFVEAEADEGLTL